MTLLQARAYFLGTVRDMQHSLFSEAGLAYVLANGGTFKDAILTWRNRQYRLHKLHEDARVLEFTSVNARPRPIEPGSIETILNRSAVIDLALADQPTQVSPEETVRLLRQPSQEDQA